MASRTGSNPHNQQDTTSLASNHSFSNKTQFSHNRRLSRQTIHMVCSSPTVIFSAHSHLNNPLFKLGTTIPGPHSLLQLGMHSSHCPLAQTILSRKGYNSLRHLLSHVRALSLLWELSTNRSPLRNSVSPRSQTRSRTLQRRSHRSSSSNRSQSTHNTRDSMPCWPPVKGKTPLATPVNSVFLLNTLHLELLSIRPVKASIASMRRKLVPTRFSHSKLRVLDLRKVGSASRCPLRQDLPVDLEVDLVSRITIPSEPDRLDNRAGV